MTEKIKFYGIDGFNRPVFKSLDEPRAFYGSTRTLFNDDATEKDVLEELTAEDLEYLGSRFGCEPCGTPPLIKLEIVKGA